MCGLPHWDWRSVTINCSINVQKVETQVSGNAKKALTFETVNQHPSPVTLDMIYECPSDSFTVARFRLGGTTAALKSPECFLTDADAELSHLKSYLHIF